MALANTMASLESPNCARAITEYGNNASAPLPPAGCNWVQFGQGNTCRRAPIRVVCNGSTQSAPVPGRVDITCDVPVCSSGDCPYGFCYWTSVHGPFWQTSKGSVPIAAPDYRGSFVRIYGEGGYWKSRIFSDATGLPPSAPPGGTVECTNFDEIVKIPNTKKCFSSLSGLTDVDGSQTFDSKALGKAGEAIYVLSGLIGNIAQANSQFAWDYLRILDEEPTALLAQQHDLSPLSPLQVGPLTGESWANQCADWAPDFVAKDMYSESDIQLVPYPQSKDVRCFITGVTGAWSSTRAGGTVQPYAQIYSGPAKDLRLRVSPGTVSGTAPPPDRVGAYASCIKLK